MQRTAAAQQSLSDSMSAALNPYWGTGIIDEPTD